LSAPPRDASAAFERGTIGIEHSGWRPPSALPEHARLEGEVTADVAVVGAGLAGASVALGLAERRIDVALIEAGQPAEGASGRNAGHVEPFLGSMRPLRKWPDAGRRLLEGFVQHRDVVFDLCAKHEIEADAAKTGVLEVARRRSAAMERNAEHWRALGYDVEVVAGARLRELAGTDRFRFGIYWREGGRVNPFLFTRGLAAAAARLGARVYGGSPVVSCEADGSAGWRIATPHGAVRASRVVVCTSGHTGNAFFPELARTHYPLVACALATAPLSARALAIVNPSRAAMMQHPLGLYPLVIDGRNRLVTSTIPLPRTAHRGDRYFDYFVRFLHRTWPALREEPIALESYWTGMTANSSSVYREDYPQLFSLARGVWALSNLGTWGNVIGPVVGLNVAHAIANDRRDDFVLPVQRPTPVRLPRAFEWKIRYVAIPAARLLDRFDLA
jgi:glycine/D-amino acid oxidase-like deaminating enzyme